MDPPVGKPQPSYNTLIAQARAGSTSALGQLFGQCRGYLLAIANEQLDQRLHAKLGGSDLVQQSLMHAQRGFEDFRGRTEGDLLAWLRRILLNEIARSNRDYLTTAKRDVSREIPFGHKEGSRASGSWLPANTETPSKQVAASEEGARVRQAIARLSAPYQRVIELRNRDLCTFAEIGARMSISEERARRLWSRAVERLRRELTAPIER